MAVYVDDVWADVLHYYGRDIYELDGPAALKLAHRIADLAPLEVVEVAGSPRPRFLSSVLREQDQRQHDQDDVDQADEVDGVKVHSDEYTAAFVGSDYWPDGTRAGEYVVVDMGDTGAGEEEG